MPQAITRYNKIRHHMLQQWFKNAAATSTSSSCSAASRVPSDVPSGHVAVCVGTDCRRFVVRATYLNHPVFRTLLAQAEEEYGFANDGPLALPCDEWVFEEILRVVSRSELTQFLNVDE